MTATASRRSSPTKTTTTTTTQRSSSAATASTPTSRPRERRTQTGALPTVARRWTARVLRTQSEAAPTEHLALGQPARRRVRAPQSAPSRHRLTPAAGPPPSSSPRPPPRSPLPAHEPQTAHHAPPQTPTTTNNRPKRIPLPTATPDATPQSHSHAYCTMRARRPAPLAFQPASLVILAMRYVRCPASMGPPSIAWRSHLALAGCGGVTGPRPSTALDG